MSHRPSRAAIDATLALRARVRTIEHRTQCPVLPSTLVELVKHYYPELDERDRAYVTEFARPTNRRLET